MPWSSARTGSTASDGWPSALRTRDLRTNLPCNPPGPAVSGRIHQITIDTYSTAFRGKTGQCIGNVVSSTTHPICVPN